MKKFLLLSVFSGIIAGCSFLAEEVSFLIWIAFIPYFLIITKLDKKQLLLCSFLLGVSFFGVMLCWVVHVSRLGLMLLSVYLSGYIVLFSFLARRFFTSKFSLYIVPAIWVICEFLREQVWTGFGWGILGYSQYTNTMLIQSVDIFGTKWLSFLIMMVNVLFVSLWQRKEYSRRYVRIVLVVLLACIGYSFWMLHYYQTEDHLEVSIIQPNISQEMKWDPLARDFILNRLSGLAQLADKNSLMIYPEASWPDIVYESTEKEFVQYLEGLGPQVLIGAVTNQQGKFYNSALFHTAGGTRRYHKIKLVPFGEYVPLRSLLGSIDVLNALGDISPGEEQYHFDYKNKRFAVLICFEDVFPLFTAQLARGSDFLINITNDAWFKGEPEASQHLAIMTMRALENRISIIRSANTGISGYVDFLGNRHLLSDQGRKTFFLSCGNFQVDINTKRSLYNRWGDIPLLLLCCFIVIIGINRIKKADMYAF